MLKSEAVKQDSLGGGTGDSKLSLKTVQDEPEGTGRTGRKPRGKGQLHW